jgi:outer membrane protein assembly factor BamE
MAGLFRIALPACRLAIGVAVLALAAGCSSLQSADNFLGVITPYRIDIVQGSVVTTEQAQQIKPGMSRVQVRDILGTPMLADLFHNDRWDYVFTFKRPGREPQRRSVVAYFKGDALERLEAPNLPSEREFVATITPENIKPGNVPTLELSDEQRKVLPKPVRVEEPTTTTTGATRTYPPLEPS